MRAIARLVALAGALGVAWLLFRDGPQEVVLVYDLARVPGATRVEVALYRDGALVRRAELAAPRDGGRLRHAVQLSGGAYRLDFQVAAPGGPVRGTRALEIEEPGTIVLSLGP